MSNATDSLSERKGDYELSMRMRDGTYVHFQWISASELRMCGGEEHVIETIQRVPFIRVRTFGQALDIAAQLAANYSTREDVITRDYFGRLMVTRPYSHRVEVVALHRALWGNNGMLDDGLDADEREALNNAISDARSCDERIPYKLVEMPGAL